MNAMVGFINMLSNICVKERPRAVFVAWDTLGVETYRNKLWPPYQGGRVFEPDIVRQLGEMPGLCEAFGFGVGKSDGYEADDLIASAVSQEVADGGECLVYTTDKDAYQLVSDKVTVLSPKKGSPDPDRIDREEVFRRFGVAPEQVTAFKALSGDSSDKIPGAKGIGPVSAAALIQKHGNLESVLLSWPNSKEAELVRMFHNIVCMRPEIDVVLPSTGPDWSSGSAALRTLGATSLADRLDRTEWT